MNLTLRQLTTFREVMLSGSISQAARTVGRTQPAVSTMISTLESELGFALFERKHGKLTPTPEARFFLEECQDVLERVERTERTLEHVRKLEAGKLRIACHPAASGAFMPRLLTRFLVGRDEVEVALIMRSSDVIEDLIASQQFDLGFAETPAESRASIEQQDYDLECVCVLRADDVLAERPFLTPQDLDNRPMAVPFDEHATARQLQTVFAREQCRLRKRFELRTFMPGLEFVAQGMCYMLCDMITAYSHVVQGAGAQNLTIRPFQPRITNSLSILVPTYSTRALLVEAFIDELAHEIEVIKAHFART